MPTKAQLQDRVDELEAIGPGLDWSDSDGREPNYELVEATVKEIREHLLLYAREGSCSVEQSDLIGLLNECGLVAHRINMEE